MSIDRTQFAIDRANILLTSSGWETVASLIGEAAIRLTVQKPRGEASISGRQILITQIAQILRPLGWSLVATDLTGDFIQATLERPIEPPALPTSPTRQATRR